MKLLCKVFGHVPNQGWGNSWDFHGRHHVNKGQGYFKVKLSEIDGLGTPHASIHADCERCGQTYQLGRIHVPQIPR